MPGLTVTSIDIDKATELGGARVIITGDFSDDQGQAFNVHVGPNGDATDTKGFSGVPGQATDLFPLNNTLMAFYLPNLDVGGPYDVFVTRQSIAKDGVLSSVLTIVKTQYFQKVFDAKRLAPPHYFVGPRNMETLEPV